MYYNKDMGNIGKHREAITKEIFIGLLEQKLTNKQIAQKLSITSSAISYYLNKYNLLSNNKQNVEWSFKELEIIKQRYIKDGSSIIDSLPGRSLGSIRRKAFELDIKTEKINPQSYSKSSLNILLEDKLTSYYWIGFLLADGWVTRNKSNENSILGLKLAIKDEDHLKKYASYIKTTNIYYFKSKNRIFRDKICTCQPTVEVTCSDHINTPKIVEKFGFNSKKTYIPPDFSLYSKLTITQFLAILIGYIDGDGNIGTGISKLKPKPRFRIKIEAHKNWLDFFNKIVDRLNIIFNTKIGYGYIRKDRENICLINLAKNKLVKKLKYLSLKYDLPILERKWNKVDLTEEDIKRFDIELKELYN